MANRRLSAALPEIRQRGRRRAGEDTEEIQRRESGGNTDSGSVSTIEFDDVEFSYTDDEQVLNGISFSVDRGEFVAFVGQSGAGKSTIVSLLARFYDPDDGEITGDGTSIEAFEGLEGF